MLFSFNEEICRNKPNLVLFAHSFAVEYRRCQYGTVRALSPLQIQARWLWMRANKRLLSVASIHMISMEGKLSICLIYPSIITMCYVLPQHHCCHRWRRFCHCCWVH